MGRPHLKKQNTFSDSKHEKRSSPREVRNFAEDTESTVAELICPSMGSTTGHGTVCGENDQNLTCLLPRFPCQHELHSWRAVGDSGGVEEIPTHRTSDLPSFNGPDQSKVGMITKSTT